MTCLAVGVGLTLCNHAKLYRTSKPRKLAHNWAIYKKLLSSKHICKRFSGELHWINELDNAMQWNGIHGAVVYCAKLWFVILSLCEIKLTVSIKLKVKNCLIAYEALKDIIKAMSVPLETMLVQNKRFEQPRRCQSVSWDPLQAFGPTLPGH